MRTGSRFGALAVMHTIDRVEPARKRQAKPAIVTRKTKLETVRVIGKPF